jgi:hypothetical protein
MMGKSCVDVLRDVTGDKSIETVADGLEKALGGGGGGVLIVNMNGETYTLDKTWQEILDADFSVLKYDASTEGNAEVYFMYPQNVRLDGEYKVEVFDPGTQDIMSFSTDSADGYPVRQQEGGPK